MKKYLYQIEIWMHFFDKKTYGHKYYVAASIGFEEKSYPFIRKMKWHTRALNLGVWGGFLPKFFVLIFGLSLDKICWLFHRPCIGLYRKQAKIIKAIPSQNVQVGTLKMQTGWDTGTPKMRNNLGHRDTENADKMLGHRDTKNSDKMLGHRDIKNAEKIGFGFLRLENQVYWFLSTTTMWKTLYIFINAVKIPKKNLLLHLTRREKKSH